MNLLGLGESTRAWPGRKAVIALVGGCNLSCRFCNSYALVIYPKKFPVYSERSIDSFLEEKKAEHLMVTGGEPLIQEGLKDFLKKLKSKGIKTGIQTNGTHPETLKELIDKKLVDFVSLDIKTVLRSTEYAFLTGYDRVHEIKRSLSLLKKGLTDYEVNLTYVPGYTREEDFTEIASQVGQVKRFVLNEFSPKPGCMDPGFECIPCTREGFIEAAAKLSKAGIGRVIMRREDGSESAIGSPLIQALTASNISID